MGTHPIFESDFDCLTVQKMIDCHAHLGEFESDIHHVIERAQAAGVCGVVMVPEYASGFERNLRLARQYPDFIFPALGLHPVQGSYAVPEESTACSLAHVSAVEQRIRSNSDVIVYIGECGLDFTPKFIRKDTDKADQIAALRAQIEFAKELRLPLNLHSRSATPQIFALLDEYCYYDCLLHAYGGKAKKAAAYAKLGCFFSVPNTAAKEASQMQNMIKAVPLESLVLETDSPALSLVLGETNEPKNLIRSAEIVAKIKNLPKEEVIRQTTQNALRLFPKIRNLLRK